MDADSPILERVEQLLARAWHAESARTPIQRPDGDMRCGPSPTIVEHSSELA